MRLSAKRRSRSPCNTSAAAFAAIKPIRSLVKPSRQLTSVAMLADDDGSLQLVAYTAYATALRLRVARDI